MNPELKLYIINEDEIENMVLFSESSLLGFSKKYVFDFDKEPLISFFNFISFEEIILFSSILLNDILIQQNVLNN